MKNYIAYGYFGTDCICKQISKKSQISESRNAKKVNLRRTQRILACSDNNFKKTLNLKQRVIRWNNNAHSMEGKQCTETVIKITMPLEQTWKYRVKKINKITKRKGNWDKLQAVIKTKLQKQILNLTGICERKSFYPTLWLVLNVCIRKVLKKSSSEEVAHGNEL